MDPFIPDIESPSLPSPPVSAAEDDPQPGPSLEDPLARLRELAAGGVDGRAACWFLIFVEDGRSRTKSGYAGRYPHVPGLEELQEDFGGGLYVIKAQDRGGDMLGDGVEIEILGPPLSPGQWRRLSRAPSPHSDPREDGEASASPPAQREVPIPNPPAKLSGGLADAIAVSVEGLTNTVQHLGRMVDKISNLGTPPYPVLDPNKIIDSFARIRGESPVTESLKVIKQIDEMVQRRVNPPEPEVEVDDEPDDTPAGMARLAGSVADFLDHLRTRKPPKEEPMERIAGVPLKDLKPIIKGMIAGCSVGWSPGQFAEVAERKVPPAYLTAIAEAGPEKVLAILRREPGSPFATESRDAAASEKWFHEAWDILLGSGPVDLDDEEDDEAFEALMDECEEHDDDETGDDEPEKPTLDAGPLEGRRAHLTQSELTTDSSSEEPGPE